MRCEEALNVAPGPDPWARPGRCGHPLRSHRLDWDDPDDGVTPDCETCGCMEFAATDGGEDGRVDDKPIVRYRPSVRAQLDALRPGFACITVREIPGLADGEMRFVTARMVDFAARAFAAGYEPGPLEYDDCVLNGNTWRFGITQTWRPRRRYDRDNVLAEAGIDPDSLDVEDEPTAAV